MIPYKTGAFLAIAAPGQLEAEEGNSPLGMMRSRDGASLQFTQNDIEKLIERRPTCGAYIDGDIHVENLINPTKSSVMESIKSLSEKLANSDCEEGRKNVFNLIFAGHGSSANGALEVSDSSISATEFYYCIKESYENCKSRLHLDLILDSCYSSKFLIDLLVESQNDNQVYPFDCFVSSLPEEKSWELNALEHGALSFHLLHKGNAYVDQVELAKAVDEQKWATIAKFLQGVTVPNPVAFLTAGRQHAVELLSGHHLEVQGAGSVELSDFDGEISKIGLATCLAKAKKSYGEVVSYKP